MVNDMQYLVNFRPEKGTIRVADKRAGLEIKGKGDAIIEVRNAEGKINRLTLHNVLYVPNLAENLLSVRSITILTGCEVHFKQTSKIIMGNDSYAMEDRGKLYCIQCCFLTKDAADASIAYLNMLDTQPASTKGHGGEKADLKTWHQRLGHLSNQVLKQVLKTVRNITITEPVPEHDCVCDACLRAKMKRHGAAGRSRNITNNSNVPGEYTHVDGIEGFKVQSPHGYKGAYLFLDDCSRIKKVYGYRHKSEYLFSVVS